MKRVKEVVDYAYDEGMYVIINAHHDTANYSQGRSTTYAKDQTGLTWTMGVPYMLFNCKTDVASQSENVKRLWTTLANEFKDYDNHLIFEDFNEILGTDRSNWVGDSSQWDNLNTLQQVFVDTVRATGGKNANRILSLCGSYGEGINHEDSMKKFNITDSAKNRIIVQLHCYKKYNGALSDGTLQKIKKYFLDKGYPVIIGETGFDITNNSSADNIKAAAAQFRLTEKYGVKNFYWDGGEFAIFDRKNLTWKDENLLKTMDEFATGNTSSNIKEAKYITTTRRLFYYRS